MSAMSLPKAFQPFHQKESLAMKLVTFNIRYDCGLDGANNFSHRRELILETLRSEQPDIVCFQEVLPHVAAWLREALPEYYVVGCPRGEALDDEQVCVAFRWADFALLKMDTWWLSPTPSVPGSRYETQSPCPRVCTELTLAAYPSRRVFRIINTHLDHESALARTLSARQILSKIQGESFFPGVPTVLTGDMNALPDSEEIQLFSQEMRNITANIGGTFHNFGREEPTQIDYIFTSADIRCKDVKKWTLCRNGVWLSDHYPVCAELEFE